MSKWYILDDDNNPVKSTVNEFADWEEAYPERKAVKQEYIDDVYISTVFLGLDHAWNSDIPVLWETMIFGGENDQAYQERYASYEQAIEGHQKAINFIKKGNYGNTE
jgi:hypothetical protein